MIVNYVMECKNGVYRNTAKLCVDSIGYRVKVDPDKSDSTRIDNGEEDLLDLEAEYCDIVIGDRTERFSLDWEYFYDSECERLEAYIGKECYKQLPAYDALKPSSLLNQQ